MSKSHNSSVKQDIAALRRARILEGAGQVFSEKGYHRANTKEIAAAAGVAEGTIYNYFKSKRALLFALLEDIASESLEGVLTGESPTEPDQFFETLIKNRAAMIRKHGRFLMPIMAEIFVDHELQEEFYQQILAPIVVLLEQTIHRWSADGTFRPVNPTVITHAIIGATMVTLTLRQSGIDDRYDDLTLEDIQAELSALFLSGIANS